MSFVIAVAIFCGTVAMASYSGQFGPSPVMSSSGATAVSLYWDIVGGGGGNVVQNIL